jgi:RNA polymerase sigma-70 factor (ECF subfamily)
MDEIEKLSDEELVGLVCDKDQELYREIVRRYQDKLLGYASYLVGDESRAAEVTQEAFVKAFVNLKGFDTKKRFSSWIYRIVHNEAVNQIKKYQRETAFALRGVAEKIADDFEVGEELCQEELRERLTACLDKLSLKYRAPLVLFYLEERSYEEISDILRMPVGTVGTRISRGRALLAAICRKEGLGKND